ncbi:MAG: ATP-binding cassette domain-containing protein [Pseudomonadota bacterium]
MTGDPLVLSGATKTFAGFTAVDDLDFTVPEGSIVGFLGPNGAGKSTSLRMALGIMTPDAGEARLFGEKPGIDALRRVGFLPEERGLYKKMSPVGTIQYFARLKGMSANDARLRAFELLEASGLQDFARARISKLSKGMAQKVQILATLAHEPDLLILDEPFSGLDPVNQQALEDLIRDQHRRGSTIVFSTHVMEHAERLCQSIVMMARGKKVFDGSLEEAFGALGRRVRIGVSGGFDLSTALAGAGYAAAPDPSEGAAGWWHIQLPQGRDAQDALRAALAAGAPISGFAPEEARLRDVFISLAGEADAAMADQPGARSTFAGAAE